MNLREALLFSPERGARFTKLVKKDEEKRTYTALVELTYNLGKEPGEMYSEEQYHVTITGPQEWKREFDSYKDCCEYLNEWGIYGVESEDWKSIQITLKTLNNFYSKEFKKLEIEKA